MVYVRLPVRTVLVRRNCISCSDIPTSTRFLCGGQHLNGRHQVRLTHWVGFPCCAWGGRGTTSSNYTISALRFQYVISKRDWISLYVFFTGSESQTFSLLNIKQSFVSHLPGPHDAYVSSAGNKLPSAQSPEHSAFLSVSFTCRSDSLSLAKMVS